MFRSSFVKQTVLAAALAITLAGCAVIEGQETTGQYVDDATVTTRVKAAFAKDDMVKSFQIHVETMDGVVQLTGFVNSVEIEQRAVSVAKSVHGVESVKDGMVVSPPNQ